MPRFGRYFDYLARIVLAIPFIAILGDYVLRGWFTAQADDDRQPDLAEIVQLGHSLLVLYALGAFLCGRRTRMNTAIIVSGVARLPATRDASGRQLGMLARAPRSDLIARGQGFAARQSRSLTANEYQVANRLGPAGRLTMLTVSAQARTRTMFMSDVEQQNAVNHCLWQCHYTMLHNTSVAIAFGNAHEEGNPCAIGDTIADRINNEVARRGGAGLGADYVNFYAAVSTSVAKALLDLARDRAVDLLGSPGSLANLHNWVTLERFVVRTPCDAFCENAWQRGWLSMARPEDNFFGALNTTQVEERYLRQLLRLLDEYRVHPRDLLTRTELAALRAQAARRWPSRFDADDSGSSPRIDEID